MALVVSEPDQKDFELPEDGQYLAVIADVIDLGEVQTGFGVKPKVQIKWLLDAFNSEGFQFQVSAFYTASLHEKANLRKALKSILGADVSGQFDLEELLGVNNQLVIQQNTPAGGEKTYANIVAILKAPKGKRLAIPDDFQRKSEKDAKNKAGKKAAAPQLKKAAPAPQTPVEADYADQEVAAPAVEPTPVKTAAPAPANRAGTIRQARTVTPAPAVAPATKAATPSLAELRAQLAAAEAAEAPASQPISDEDIPF